MISASQSRFDRAAGAILLRLRTQPSFNGDASVHAGARMIDLAMTIKRYHN
jgi:hypothetical protein